MIEPGRHLREQVGALDARRREIEARAQRIDEVVDERPVPADADNGGDDSKE